MLCKDGQKPDQAQIAALANEVLKIYVFWGREQNNEAMQLYLEALLKQSDKCYEQVMRSCELSYQQDSRWPPPVDILHRDVRIE